MSTIANNFPIRVFCQLASVPGEDIAKFGDSLNKLHYLQHIPISVHADELEAAPAARCEYTSELVDIRRADPVPTVGISLFPDIY